MKAPTISEVGMTNSGPVSGSRPAGQAPSGLVGSRIDPGQSKAPYGPMCRNPELCAGKGYCPRDPTCGD